MARPVAITSSTNPELARFRLAAAGRSPGLVLLEGVRLAGEALAAGLAPEAALVSPALARRPGGEALRERLLAGSGRVLEAPERLLAKVSAVESAQGVLLLARRPAWDEGRLRAACRLLLLAGLQDPGNVGALFRTALAAGVEGVLLLPGTADPLGPKALRASAGAALRLPALELPILEAVAWLREGGIRLVAADPAGVVDFRSDVWRVPLALALGAEGQGLAPELAAAAEARVRIPLAGGVESLNVAAAGALLLFEAVRRREEQ